MGQINNDATSCGTRLERSKAQLAIGSVCGLTIGVGVVSNSSVKALLGFGIVAHDFGPIFTCVR